MSDTQSPQIEEGVVEEVEETDGVKLSKVLMVKPAVEYLNGLNFSGKNILTIRKALKPILNELKESYDDVYNEKIKELGTEDKNTGNISIAPGSENHTKFTDFVKDLLETNVDIDFKSIDIKILKDEKIKIAPVHLMQLIEFGVVESSNKVETSTKTVAIKELVAVSPLIQKLVGTTVDVALAEQIVGGIGESLILKVNEVAEKLDAVAIKYGTEVKDEQGRIGYKFESEEVRQEFIKATTEIENEEVEVPVGVIPTDGLFSSDDIKLSNNDIDALEEFGLIRI